MQTRHLPHPLLIIVSGPSGAGKSTLCKRLLAEFPQIRYSISCTTREPRGAEKDGEAYHFISKEEFKSRIGAGEFLEHADVHGNFYGTLKSEVEGVLETGGSVLMDIDVAGAAQVRGKVRTLPQGNPMREGLRDVFVDTPSLLEMRRRLEKRGEDSKETIMRRLENARQEMARAGEFAFKITNHNLDDTYAEFREIMLWGRQWNFKRKFPGKKAILLDLDGTVYAGDAAIPGAADFVRDCTARGIRCVFVTNRANRTPEEVRDQLLAMGIPCETRDIITTATATALHIKEGSAFVVGEHGLVSALEAQGIRITDEKPDYVVASLDRFFDYEKLRRAAWHLLDGAKFIATNRDAFLKTENDVIPGAGSIVAAIMTASGKTPTVIGKPEPLLIETALELCGVSKDEALLVGDNISTDIAAGINAGVDSVLLLTGVTTREQAAGSQIAPSAIAADYDELREMI